jgi:hypothetical protein
MKKINRRDFIKLAGTVSASLALQHVFPRRLPPGSFSDVSLLVGENFEKDYNSAFMALDNLLLVTKNTPSSLIFGIAEKLRFIRRLNHAQGKDYPRGLPGLIDYPLYFRLATVFDGVIAACQKLKSPYLAYFHL